MLLLNKEEVQGLINMDDAISAVEEAYKAFNSGRVDQPEYIGIHMAPPRGEIDFKAGYNLANEVVSMKASSGGFVKNTELYGLPANMGTISLFDAKSCALVCIMDGSLITGYRTGGAGAVSVKALARKDAKDIASIGTGNQARMQIRAISRVMRIENIYAWDENPQALAAFKKDIEEELNIAVTGAASKQDAVSRGDIVITTTRGKGSLVQASWVKKGTHIIAIGTDQPGKQEFEPEIFRGAIIVNDSIEQCVTKGETQHGIGRGILKREDIYGEIGEILLGRKPGRTDDDKITIFDSTGMAIQDNTTAYKVYQRAAEKGIGTRYSFF